MKGVVVLMEDILMRLAEALAKYSQVSAVALSGGSRPLPMPGDGDLDVFVYGREVLALTHRLAAYGELPEVTDIEPESLAGGRWGVADRMSIDGVETWVMYFTLAEAESELTEILSGNVLGKQDNYFYPTGRLAMLRDFRVLYDGDGYLGQLMERVEAFPESLVQGMLSFHMDALADREDLVRAVARQDVLFYHFALDLALDHVLQALFVLNRVFFPSRKRSLELIDGFKIKPDGFGRRLLDVTRLGSSADTLTKSYQELCGIIDWLEARS